MHNHLIHISAAAALLAALPAVASAQDVAYNVSPVTVSACSTDATFLSPTQYDATHLELTSLSTSYVNRANVPATRVKLILNDGQSQKTIVDRGSFAPGATIDRTYVTGVGIAFSAQTPSCNIAEVDFADGSSWHAASTDVAAR